MTTIADKPADSPLQSRLAWVAYFVCLVAAVTLTYSNHFENSFHFDDYHSITDNIFIRDLGNGWNILTDAKTSSTLPPNRAWRPLVTLSLALDYRLGHGYAPFWFHFSTLAWFVVQLGLMAALYVGVLRPYTADLRTRSAAAFAVAWYGLHPVMAETINYIIQRAEVYSTLGVVGAMLIFVRYPVQRRFGLYLLPLGFGLLAKTPAVVFPILAAAYLWLFEAGETPGRLRRIIICILPSVVFCGGFIALQSAMTPGEFQSGSASAFGYLITQPYVVFRYFVSFFLPLHLSADTDLAPFTSAFQLEVLGGFSFLAAILCVIYQTSQQASTRPVSFGLIWFLAALLPTSVFPLAEVENDHRMYFAYVGLALAMVWAGVCVLPKKPFDGASRIAFRIGLALILIFSAAGTYRRNEVWKTEESLWHDVTLKSPRNGRGLMNFGLTQMAKGEYQAAAAYFERALPFTPNYSALQINLGIAYAGLGRHPEAEVHFQRAIALAPQRATAYHFLARWLKDRKRIDEAVTNLATAIRLNPVWMEPRQLLLQIHADVKHWPELKALAEDGLRLVPGEPSHQRHLETATNQFQRETAGVTARRLLDESLTHFNAKAYRDCIRAATEAIRLQPNFAEAYNNVAAGHAALGEWTDAAVAARTALRLKPNFTLARNNLAWAESEIAKRRSPQK